MTRGCPLKLLFGPLGITPDTPESTSVFGELWEVPVDLDVLQSGHVESTFLQGLLIPFSRE